MSAVALGGDLGIEAAVDLKQQLAPYVVQPQAIVLDARSVQRIHTASVQVLCTFVRERRRCGYDTTFADSSDIFRDAVRLLGLTAQLGLSTAPDQLEKTVENPA